MLIFPYSTALSLARPPWASYATVAACALLYTLQLNSSITAALMYYPDSWDPVTMVSSALLHGGFWHLLGNIVFFMAFAPALEILIGNALLFVGIMIFIALTSGFGYSLWIAIGGSEALPTLGFSGVVMGMIGLAAYMMPRARIRVFFWLIVWKTFFVPAWILAIIYIGLDAWTMFSADSFGGINLVAHVAGGLSGYVFGMLLLKQRKEDTSDALADEIEAMRVEQRFGKTRAEAWRYKKRTDPIREQRSEQRDQDRFMGRIYRLVEAHRDSEAMAELLERYHLESDPEALEKLLQRVSEWGSSRCLLCCGRLLIARLEREHRYGRALEVIEHCQAFSAGFVLPDLSRTLFYAEMAMNKDKPGITRRLLDDAASRYRGLVDARQGDHLLQRSIRGRG